MSPRRNGMGPAGEGPKTGGQRGSCAGAKSGKRPLDGRGRGVGRGLGRKRST